MLRAANVFSFDVRDVARMQHDNRRGTEVVGHEGGAGRHVPAACGGDGDTVRWLYEAGHISGRQTGRAVGR